MLDDGGGEGRNALQVLFVAAENDALRGAKVGGIGDVLRDLPAALSRHGVAVTVVLPSYGFLHLENGAQHIGSVSVRFRDGRQTIDVYDLPDTYVNAVDSPRMRILHSADFAPCGERRVYCDDPTDSPFATDASKYALFGAAVLESIRSGHLGGAEVLHLHDWHAAFVAILVERDPDFRALTSRHRVFSIHNLSLQGIRPFKGHESSFFAWYPWLQTSPMSLADPRWTDCVNPMAAGIRLADRVHTVSPTYASEVVRSNEPERGFHGGEGLERDLQRAASDQRLLGILNGIDYPQATPAADASDDEQWRRWMKAVAKALEMSIADGEHVRSVDWIAHQRAQAWSDQPRPTNVLTSVGRLVEQKAAIFAVELEDGRSVLEHLLGQFAKDTALLIIGTGDPALERLCSSLAARNQNFLFINRYDAALADAAYAYGDLFLMPSSFEPCGISQMIAMRHGQPCLVHAVGGLVDTVDDEVDGFHFRGDSLASQGQAMLNRLVEVLKQRTTDPYAWRAVCNTAATRRFDWDAAAVRYLSELYNMNRSTT